MPAYPAWIVGERVAVYLYYLVRLVNNQARSYELRLGLDRDTAGVVFAWSEGVLLTRSAHGIRVRAGKALRQR